MGDNTETVQKESYLTKKAMETKDNTEVGEALSRLGDGTVIDPIEAVKEEVYKIEDLINNCKALGYRKEAAIGALFNCENTEMTKTEFKNRITKFLGKKVI